LNGTRVLLATAQKLLPVSATGGGRRCCTLRIFSGKIIFNSQFWKICGFSRIAFSREGRKGEPAKTPDAKTGLLHEVLCSSPVHNLYTF
jgi:hypothetical protein